jgi:hypothetical protein
LRNEFFVSAPQLKRDSLDGATNLMWVLVTLLLVMQPVAQAPVLIPAESVCTSTAQFTGPCTKIRGRITLANGGFPFKIWPVGTRRFLGVDISRCELPTNIQQFVEEEKDVYGDLEIRPLTPSEPGVMQMVCLASAVNTRTRPAALVTPVPNP